jgi:hypothetical protein
MATKIVVMLIVMSHFAVCGGVFGRNSMPTTAAPLNSAYTAEEFEFYILDSEAKLLITPKERNKSVDVRANSNSLSPPRRT